MLYSIPKSSPNPDEGSATYEVTLLCVIDLQILGLGHRGHRSPESGTSRRTPFPPPTPINIILGHWNLALGSPRWGLPPATIPRWTTTDHWPVSSSARLFNRVHVKQETSACWVVSLSMDLGQFVEAHLIHTMIWAKARYPNLTKANVTYYCTFSSP